MRTIVVLWTVFALVNICVLKNVPTPKIDPLQPLSALDIGAFVPEPSGLAFCNSTGHVYAISDDYTGSTHIYELDIDGSFVTKWKFPKDLEDLEGIACDDLRGVLYVIEEEKKHVSSYVRPTYDPENSHQQTLIPLGDFYVEDETALGTGLEGITVDYIRDLLYVANEKSPKQIFTLTHTGTYLGSVFPQFGSDIGDIFFDEVLDILWMVSDQSERLYAMDPTATILYDYWDVDMRNPEGLAINYLHDPPLMYIATDPSASKGPPFVPALFIFEKPQIGTGLLFYDPKNPKSNNQGVECNGCDQLWDEVKAIEDDYYARVSRLEIKFLLESVIPIGIIVGPVVVIVIFVVVIKLRKYDPSLYQSVSESETELEHLPESTQNSELVTNEHWPSKYQADFAILAV